MTHTVRRAGRAALILFALAMVGAPAVLAETDYPAKPIKVIVGFPAGSVADVVARQVGQKIGQDFGWQWIVDDRPGAAGNIAAELVVRAPKDGYTLMMATIANTINATVYRNLSFDFAADLVPVMLIGSVPNVLAVNPALPVNSVQDLITLAKAKPGEIFYASSGNGTAAHLSGELFNLMAGVKLAHVPYKGSPEVMNDLLAGRVMVTFTPASAVWSHRQAGTVRVLASTGPQRTVVAPDLPTIAESGLPGFDTSIWVGLLAPSGTPPEIVERLAKAVGAVLATPEIKEQFARQGMDEIGLGLRAFKDFIRQDIEKWAKVVKVAGVRVD
ncbi:MAG TPA: tripartite tricarboxylate transporter substrate binding protein [Alphaproteobacteria bacterium]